MVLRQHTFIGNKYVYYTLFPYKLNRGSKLSSRSCCSADSNQEIFDETCVSTLPRLKTLAKSHIAVRDQTLPLLFHTMYRDGACRSPLLGTYVNIAARHRRRLLCDPAECVDWQYAMHDACTSKTTPSPATALFSSAFERLQDI